MTIERVICNLRLIRTHFNYSQEYLVRDANHVIGIHNVNVPFLDRVTLSKAENGSVILIPAHVRAIASVFGCTAHDIYPGLYPAGGDANAE